MSLTNPVGESSASERPLVLISTDDSQEPGLGENAGPGPAETPMSIRTIGTPDYPVWFFFCCNLSKPAILKTVLKLGDDPVFRPASVIGHATHQRGIYPVLIDSQISGEVSGYACEAQNKADEEKLASYNTGSEKQGFHPQGAPVAAEWRAPWFERGGPERNKKGIEAVVHKLTSLPVE